MLQKQEQAPKCGSNEEEKRKKYIYISYWKQYSWPISNSSNKVSMKIWKQNPRNREEDN
jgi:hypothetical protein